MEQVSPVAAVLVGGAVGFVSAVVSALVATEAKSWLERRRARARAARLLHDEISVNRKNVERIQKRVLHVLEVDEWFYAVPMVTDAFSSSLQDLPLVPTSTSAAVHRFYAFLSEIDYIVREAYFQMGAIYPPGPEEDEDPLEIRRLLRTEFLQHWVLHVTGTALETADDALAELAKLLGAPPTNVKESDHPPP